MEKKHFAKIVTSLVKNNIMFMYVPYIHKKKNIINKKHSIRPESGFQIAPNWP